MEKPFKFTLLKHNHNVCRNGIFFIDGNLRCRFTYAFNKEINTVCKKGVE